MNSSTGRKFFAPLPWWVDRTRRHAWLVVLLALASSVWAMRYTGEHLGIDTDTADIISPNLPWRRDYIEYKTAFPAFADTLILVVTAETPALASKAGRALAEGLQDVDELVQSVETPGAGEFFERHALLYLGETELAELGDRLARIQPFLGILARDPTLTGFTDLLRRVIDGRDERNAIDLAPILTAMTEAAESASHGRFHQVSWQRLLSDRPPQTRDTRRIVVVKPHLDWNRLLPAGPVIEHVRILARDLQLTPDHGIRVRITGSLAMEHEELQAAVRGAKRAGLLALVLVGIVLVLSLRSIRLVTASLLTLLAGLAWTAAFATYAVGHLNLISVAFAVLYIGLGIAYAIHVCLRYEELVAGGLDHGEALTTTASDVGGSLLVCAITTGVGFYAFVPTDFVGVSELGIISGTGMFISLFASLTVLPALLTLMPLEARAASRTLASARRRTVAEWPVRHRRAILFGALLLTLCASIALPAVRFDGNPVSLRDPESESVTTFMELMSESESAPASVNVLAGDAYEASRLVRALEPVETVAETRVLEDFIPSNQDVKLALIEEMDLLLGPELGAEEVSANSTPAERRGALARLVSEVRRLSDDPVLGSQAEALRAALTALRDHEPSADSSDDPSARFERSLVGDLDEQLRLIRRSLDADEVGVNDLPSTLVERWIAPDGRRRIAVYPSGGLFDQEAMASFLEDVRQVAPRITGTPVVYVESARVVVLAFQQAFALALASIVIVLFVLLKRLRYVIQVLIPLLMASVLTVAVMVLFDIPFNFANVIALPLLLGVGVDNGIHMVHRMQVAPPVAGNVLETSTARAVIASALTTVFSFGNLAFSPHPGTASMGIVLCVGLSIMLIASVVVLPALMTGMGTCSATTDARSS